MVINIKVLLSLPVLYDELIYDNLDKSVRNRQEFIIDSIEKEFRRRGIIYTPKSQEEIELHKFELEGIE